MKSALYSLVIPSVLLSAALPGCAGRKSAITAEAPPQAAASIPPQDARAMAHRQLQWKRVPPVFMEGALSMGTLFLVIVLAMALNQFLALEQVPQSLAERMQGLIGSKWAFAVLMNVFLLIVGCFMDIISAILILAPILVPMAVAYGFDPVHFGIIFIVNLEIGYLTPPMGINLFVASSVFKQPLEKVVAACLPFIAIMIGCLAMITVFPAISLWLVSRLGR